MKKLYIKPSVDIALTDVSLPLATSFGVDKNPNEYGSDDFNVKEWSLEDDIWNTEE